MGTREFGNYIVIGKFVVGLSSVGERLFGKEATVGLLVLPHLACELESNPLQFVV